MRPWLLLTFAWACGEGAATPTDAGQRADAGLDVEPDGGFLDAQTIDAAAADAQPQDAQNVDPCPESQTQHRFELGSESSQVDLLQGGCRRTYRLTTTAALRDPNRPKTLELQESGPTLRSGNLGLDALYALALEEARQNSVNAISDGAFNNGQPVPCPEGGCFETGRLWKYVWTRDIAYSVDLGLAELDPLRAMNSLVFKLSTRRDGSDRQIVQDTGSGGSYPVSTDRVVWALGARRVLPFLEAEARLRFSALAFEALRNTVQHDRVVAYDPADGLYRGEQSFLDWREQSYPPWVQSDVVHLAMSKSLSTNLLHLDALFTVAELGRLSGADVTTYLQWAQALQTAIRARFAREPLWPALVPTTLDPAPSRYDFLALCLGILQGTITENEARVILSRYPVLPAGPPVMAPQSAEVPIYHNRAVWPFVTAYGYLAAAKARHDGMAVAAYESLVRSAALQLSHVENVEAVSGAPWVQDEGRSGPVVHSERQLWSVAGFVALIHRGLFGMQLQGQQVRFRPYVPKALRASFTGAQMTLNNLPLGPGIRVVLRFPNTTTGGGAYAVGSVRLDGAEVGESFLELDSFENNSTLEIELLDQPEAAQTVTLSPTDPVWLYGPRTPRITQLVSGAGPVTFQLQHDETRGPLNLRVMRDGALVASLKADATTWTDPNTGDHSPSHCYTIESVFTVSGNVSHRAAPQCYWGPNYNRIQNIVATDFVATGGTLVNNHGRWHYENWGDPGHRLVATFTARRGGRHYVQVNAGNGAGPVNTGITCGIKRVRVEEVGGGEVGRGYLIMPHQGRWDLWRDSNFVAVSLTAQRPYRITIDDDPFAVNMSAFEHFARYTGGMGGTPFNRVNIAEIKILGVDP